MDTTNKRMAACLALAGLLALGWLVATTYVVAGWVLAG